MTENALIEILPPAGRSLVSIHESVAIYGPAAEFAWDEFFSGFIRNRNTRLAYKHAVTSFLEWAKAERIGLVDLKPGAVGRYFDQLKKSIPTKKQHLAALRAFFDVLVNRHVIPINPALTVRGERYSVAEGKTPEISRDQARRLLESVDTKRPVGLRDKAIIATLIYTAARAGAIANLQMRDLIWDGSQYSLRFLEKGGKSRQIPVRHDLQLLLLNYLATLDATSAAKDSPLFRSVIGRTGRLTKFPLRNIDICRMVKRRLHDARLPDTLSPHSFRVATVTDLLIQGVSLEDVQYLAGHADPRTTRLYDRRQKTVTRNTVERISI
jgi:integrase/recombinase XerD